MPIRCYCFFVYRGNMKKTEERDIAEKIVQSIRRKHYKKRLPEAYIKRLENLLIIQTESQLVLRKAQIQSSESLKELGKVLPSLGESSLNLFESTWKVLMSSVESKIKLKKLESDISKYRQGKKVLKKNFDIYCEIIETNKKRIANGEDTNYRKSTEITLKDKPLSDDKKDQIYKNFNDWFNNPKNKEIISLLLSK